MVKNLSKLNCFEGFFILLFYLLTFRVLSLYLLHNKYIIMVAPKKTILTIQKIKHPVKKNPGIHSKNKSSKLKSSKHYKKQYRGQGR